MVGLPNVDPANATPVWLAPNPTPATLTHIGAPGDYLIKAGRGWLAGVSVNTAATSGALTVYDGVDVNGAVMAVIDVTQGGPAAQGGEPWGFQTGLFLVLSGSDGHQPLKRRWRDVFHPAVAHPVGPPPPAASWPRRREGILLRARLHQAVGPLCSVARNNGTEPTAGALHPGAAGTTAGAWRRRHGQARCSCGAHHSGGAPGLTSCCPPAVLRIARRRGLAPAAQGSEPPYRGLVSSASIMRRRSSKAFTFSSAGAMTFSASIESNPSSSAYRQTGSTQSYFQ